MESKTASVAESPASDSDAVLDRKSDDLVKKIDRRILPLMCIVYGLAHVDKIVMGFTLLFGFKQDLGISAYQYSWCLAIFFLGYLIAAWPASVLLQYFATTRVVAISVLAWAILLLGMLGVKNFSQLLVVRLFLGIFEASITPGLITYTSRWYTRNEQVYRTMLWGAMQTGFSIFGTLASYGLLRIDYTSLERWRYPFLLLGVLNFFAGLGWLFFMPESPATATFLDENERKIATDRVAENMMRSEKTPWKAYQIWEGVKDIKIWLLFLFTFLSQLAGNALAAFASPILGSFGFDRYQTLLITIPAWIISLVTVITYGYLSQRFHNGRTIIMMLGTIVSVIASALEYADLGPTQKVKWGKAVALWFTGVAAVLWPVALTVVGQNIAGETKKGLTSTLILVAYATSNTIAPFISGAQDSAGFTRLLAVVMSCYACAFAAALLLRLYMSWKNSTRDKKYGPADAEVAKAEGIRDGLGDKTDRENKSFRYLL